MLQALGDKLECGKLKLSPTACYGCPDNPKGNEKKRLDASTMEQHKTDIDHIERLHDAVRMGLVVRLGDLKDLEFEMLRGYWWEIEKIRMKSGVRL